MPQPGPRTTIWYISFVPYPVERKPSAPLMQMKLLPFKNRKAVSKTVVTLQPRPLPSLGMCILMDLIGYASFAIPLVGEVIDLAWAPVSAAIYMKMFGFKKGFFGGIFQFVEELLPGFDIIPTFTITWFIQNAKRNKEMVTLRSFTP